MAKLASSVKINRAPILRQMLETLVKHRECKRATQSTTNEPDEIVSVKLSEIKMLPSWQANLKRAAKDGVEQSLIASIREEGWRAFVEGGCDAMSELLDEACGNDGDLAIILIYRWDGIGGGKDFWYP